MRLQAQVSENPQRGTFGSGRGPDLLKAEPLGRLARHDPSAAQAELVCSVVVAVEIRSFF